ncbi:MAG: TetR/AcrR family transcriptional regulator [Bacillota bacterium]|nr:TetR/AcrR family transcriptional regulator [Bacillota bacterium]
MTKKESKEKRIEDIIDAAVNVFVDKGYENTTMSEIAEQAGISKGGLYHHFLSKDMVMLYANQKLMEPCNDMLFKAKQNTSACEGLKKYIFEYIGYWTQRKKELIFFSLSMAKAMTHMDIFKLYEKYVEDYISSVEALFKKGIDSDEFIMHDPRGSAISLISALDGVTIYMTLDKKMKLEDISNYFIDRLIEPIIKK